MQVKLFDLTVPTLVELVFSQQEQQVIVSHVVGVFEHFSHLFAWGFQEGNSFFFPERVSKVDEEPVLFFFVRETQPLAIIWIMSSIELEGVGAEQKCLVRIKPYSQSSISEPDIFIGVLGVTCKSDK